MEKIYKPISQTLTVLGILLFTATSCGSDDNNDTPNETLQGLWRLTEIIYAPIIDTTEVSTEAETSGVADTTITYPDQEGVQPYIRFNNASSYVRFEVTTADTITEEAGGYTLGNNEITTLTADKEATTYGYTISGKQLIMIEKDDAAEISYFAVKVDGDPFLPEAPTENEDPGNTDDEELTGCAIYHDTENAPLGSSLNPILIDAGEIITDTLYAVEGRNGYAARYYLEVEPYAAYRIKIRDLITDYADMQTSFFKYTTISATYTFSPDQSNFSTDIEVVGESPEGESLLEFDLFPTSSCLYIEFFSYQKDVAFRFEVEDLSATQD